jgi:hypothetical protein
MKLDTVTYPPGTEFYKGFSENYGHGVLHDEKYFFVAKSPTTASVYKREKERGYICKYVSTRPLHLVKITVPNIKKILKEIESNAISFAFKKGTTFEKLKLLEKLVPKKTYNHYKNIVVGSIRTSLYETNKQASQGLCSIPNIDGYYYRGSKYFHGEVMICDASRGTFVKTCNKKSLLFSVNVPIKRGPPRKVRLFNLF